jgi:hypothetical protein
MKLCICGKLKNAYFPSVRHETERCSEPEIRASKSKKLANLEQEKKSESGAKVGLFDEKKFKLKDLALHFLY